LFIRKGGVVGTKDFEGHVEILADDDEDVVWSGPLVVLTSRLSASASEIVAGALHDYHRAVIVGGDHTFGKGTVQKLARLPMDLGAMKVTIGMFFLPGGKSTQHLGVSSDVRIPSVLNSEDIGEVKMDYSLAPQSITHFVSADANVQVPASGTALAADPELAMHWTPVDDSIVKKLAEKSAERVNKDPKFAEVRKELEEITRNKGVTRLAELRKKAEAENKVDKKTKKNRKDKAKDLESPYLQEGVNIGADMVTLKSSATMGSL
jgi:carboxyl-terminal processing protease